jgi:hypothetical protein
MEEKELKAKAYDLIVAQEQIQQELRLIHQELIKIKKQSEEKKE